MGLIVHAVEVLDDGLLDLLHPFGGFAGLGVDAEDRAEWTCASSRCDQQR